MSDKLNLMNAGDLRSARFQYWAAAAVLFLALIGGILPTPVYPLWQQRFGLSTGTIAGVYSVYPLGVIAGLLFGGRVSDQLGRRVVIGCGLLIGMVSAALFTAANGVGSLFAARLIYGFAIGLLSGPAISAIVELHPRGDRKQGSRFGAMTTMLAIVSGSLLSSLLVRFPPAPLLTASLPFIVLFNALAVALLIIVVYLPETVPAANRLSVWRVSFRPQGLMVPAAIRTEFWTAALVGLLSWAGAGLWLALGPSLVFNIAGNSDRLLGGLAVVAVFGVAGSIQAAFSSLNARFAMQAALFIIPLSLALIVFTLARGSAPVLALGCVLAGVAQGLGWMGSSEYINRLAPPAHRASTVSAFYVLAYAGAAIPVLTVGVAADFLGLMKGVVVLAVLAASASLFLLNRLREPRHHPNIA